MVTVYQKIYSPFTEKASLVNGDMLMLLSSTPQQLRKL